MGIFLKGIDDLCFPDYSPCHLRHHLKNHNDQGYQLYSFFSAGYVTNEVLFGTPKDTEPGDYSVKVNLAEDSNAEQQHSFVALNGMFDYRYLETIG